MANPVQDVPLDCARSADGSASDRWIAVLFFGSVRGLSLLEGRLVAALLGERMPRRPTYSDRSRSGLQRIGDR